MTITLNGTTGINTPGVVNTAAQTVATTLAVTGVSTLTGGFTVGATAAPAFSAYSTVGNSVADSTFTKLTSNTTRFDTNTNYASSRFTPTVAGYYQVNAVISCVASATGFTQVFFYKNGSAYLNGPAISNATFGPNIGASTLISLNGSIDYVELYIYQNSGLTSTLYMKDFNCFLARSA